MTRDVLEKGGWREPLMDWWYSLEYTPIKKVQLSGSPMTMVKPYRKEGTHGTNRMKQ